MESSTEDVFEIPEVVLHEGDIAIDKSGSFTVIQLSTGLKDRLCHNLGKAVIVSLLGKTIGYKALCSRLQSLWDISQASILDIGRGFFLVQFSDDADYMKALCAGPWVINGAYLLVQKWSPDFRVSNGTVTITTIDNEIQKVEYENLIAICFACGRIGHSDIYCPHKTSTDTGADQGGGALDSISGEGSGRFGAWMVVEKRKRNGRGPNSSLGKNTASNKQGSRFAILDERNEDFQGDIPAAKETVPLNKNIPNSSDFAQENSHIFPPVILKLPHHVVEVLLKSKE